MRSFWSTWQDFCFQGKIFFLLHGYSPWIQYVVSNYCEQVLWGLPTGRMLCWLFKDSLRWHPCSMLLLCRPPPFLQDLLLTSFQGHALTHHRCIILICYYCTSTSCTCKCLDMMKALESWIPWIQLSQFGETEPLLNASFRLNTDIKFCMKLKRGMAAMELQWFLTLAHVTRLEHLLPNPSVATFLLLLSFS